MARVASTAHLVILGTGPLEAELRQLTAALGLGPRVRFVGFEPNVVRWMRAADGFVLSSRYEGLPTVLMEAGACEVPAIATDVPGTREVIVNDATGWLAPAGDPTRLSDAMSRLMCTPILQRRAMGMRARQHITQRFSMDVVLDRWEQLYAELLERKNLLRHSSDRRIRPTVWETLRRRSAHSA
jgi:glycosyltransferase involved in cell wall biosynthesis